MSMQQNGTAEKAVKLHNWFLYFFLFYLNSPRGKKNGKNTVTTTKYTPLFGGKHPSNLEIENFQLLKTESG